MNIFKPYSVVILASVLYLFFVSNHVIAMNDNQLSIMTINNEQQLGALYQNEIKTFWQQGNFSHFSGVDNTRINYVEFTLENNDTRPCIIIVPGRSEGYLKYQELAFELHRQGYNSFIIDHRGQGISQRLLDNKYKGYVVSFDDYVKDLAQFIDTIVLPKCQAKPYILAHSMGGLIATHYMQQNPSVIQSAVLSSPMISISSGSIPKWLAKFVIYVMDFFNKLLSNEPWYFLGQSDVTAETYSIEKFQTNPLMQSQLRFEQFSSLYASTPDIQLGGVTVHWLSQALAAETQAFEKIEHLSTPTLILQAGADSIVDNDAQNDFCEALNKAHPHSCPTGKPIIINDARHELLFESDRYRVQALTEILQWFKNVNKV